MSQSVIVTPGAPRWVLATVIGAALGVGVPAFLPAAPLHAQVQPAPSPSPSLTPEERAREAEKETLEEEAPAPAPSPEASPSPSPSPSPSASPTPEPTPTPEPSPSPAPEATPIPTPTPTPEPTPTPTPEPTPTPAPTPTPEATPTPAPPPTPEATPTTPPAPAPEPPTASPAPPAEGVAPTPEPSPAEGAKEQETPTNLLEKLPTFGDIEDIDLNTLLKVTAGDEGSRTVDDEPGIVTVVSEEDIRRSGARTLQEVLQTVAGLEVLTDGVGRSRIVVRGLPAGIAAGSSENVLVMLNGMRLNESIFGGATAVNLDFAVDNVKRIEIMRGPGAVTFGPGALLGVINIVTESVDTFRRDELTLGGGSFRSFLYNYRYGTTFHEVSLAGFMQFSYTGGPELDVPVDAQTERDAALAPFGIRPVSLAPGHTNDNRKSLDANIAMAYRRFTFNGRLKKESGGGFVGLLDTLGRQNQFANTQSHVNVEYRRSLRLGDVRARAGFSEGRVGELFDVYPAGFTLVRGTARVSFPSGVLYQEDLNSRRLGADATLERSLTSRHTLTAGAGLERESTFGLRVLTNFDFVRQQPLPGYVSLPALVPPSARTVASVFVQDAWNPTSRLGVTGGLRLDHYGDVGGLLQPRLAGVYRFPKDFTIKAGYGRGMRAPTLLERFYSSPAFRANAALDRARSDTLDGTVLFRRKDLRVSVTAYRTWLRDGILPDGEGIPPLGTPPPIFANLPGFDARGVDVEASRNFGGSSSVVLAYSLQHAEETRSGRRLAGVPSHLGRLGANFPAGKYVILSPSLTFRGARPRAAGDDRPELGGYSLFDVVARLHNFHPRLELSAVVRDLFGQDYFDPSPLGGLPGDYPRTGRAIFVKAKYRF